MAQSDGSSLGCRITIDGEVRSSGGPTVPARTPSVWTSPGEPAVIAKLIRRLAVPILLAWMALAAFTNTSVPPLEKVAEAHNVALSARTPRR